MQNPPSLAALKLMHILIARAGPRMGEDVLHEIRLSEIRRVQGMRNHDRGSLEPLFAELRAAVLIHDDPSRKRLRIGGFLDTADVDYREDGGDLVIGWYFSRFFTAAAAASEHWAILDRQVALRLKSRYSMLLFQHISSLVNLSHVTSRVFSVAELRAVLAVDAGALDRFANLNRWALQPAIAEINEADAARFTLTAALRKTGRTVTAVEITWTPKPDLIRRPPRLIAAHHAASAAERVTEAPKAQAAPTPAATGFPPCGSIAYSPHWQGIKRAAGCNMDDGKIAADFRRFCQGKGIALDARNIEKVFSTFCAKVGKV